MTIQDCLIEAGRRLKIPPDRFKIALQKTAMLVPGISTNEIPDAKREEVIKYFMTHIMIYFTAPQYRQSVNDHVDERIKKITKSN